LIESYGPALRVQPIVPSPYKTDRFEKLQYVVNNSQNRSKLQRFTQQYPIYYHEMTRVVLI
jgi:hypothetical protein